MKRTIAAFTAGCFAAYYAGLLLCRWVVRVTLP